MLPIRIKACSESDLRMLGDLAHNIQRVLPVTQADIDAAAALGEGWVVWKVIEVTDPIDNLRGGTQLVIKQNSITPGQNVRRVLIVSGPGGETVVIGPGPSPLLLPDAVANSLSYVKAFGGTEQRNIPQPYTQVNYVTNTASTAVDTGIMIDFAKNYEFEVECRAVSGSWYILQSRASSSGNITGIHGATSGSTITLVVGNVTVCTSAITRTVGNKLYVKATLNAGTATLYVKDETANTEDTQTGSYGTSQPNPTASVYLLGNAGGQYVDVNSDIYMARIKENDTVVMDYVPCRQVATAGFYDKASGTFKTALTPANLSADGNTVPTPDTPMDIVSNNGVLKYGYKTVNMFDKNNTLADGTIWVNDGNRGSLANYYGTNEIHVIGGHTYTRSGTHGIANYIKLSDGTWINQSDGSATITMPANAVLWVFNNKTETSRDTMMVVEGTALPNEYVPYGGYGLYVDGTQETITDSANHTANVATLLGVGDYRDTQNINTGAITRKVGVKVLDGTENWVYADTNRFSIYLENGRAEDNQNSAYCSHFAYVKSPTYPTTDMYFSLNRSSGQCRFALYYTAYTTAADFKAYLAQQYAAGTPVIIVYPLATSTTESVAGQTMQVTDGDNVLEITQASLNGLELEAQYQAAVSLTIQEVQDANLDPNVEVTIN